MRLLSRNGAGGIAWLPAGSIRSRRLPPPRPPSAPRTAPSTAGSAFAPTGGRRPAHGGGLAQGDRSLARRIWQARARRPRGIPRSGERRSGAWRTSVGGDDSMRMAPGERDGRPCEDLQLQAALPETARSTRRAHDRRTNAPDSIRRSRAFSPIPIATRPGRRFRRGAGSPCARRAPRRGRSRASRAGTEPGRGRVAFEPASA